LISWIIAAYNEEKRLPQTLYKLSNEYGDQDFEIIVSDDGSRDKTYKIALAFSQAHNNVKVVTDRHKGRGAALRNGFKATRGEVVVFSSADIVIPRKYMAKLVKDLSNYDLIMLSKHVSGSIGLNESIIRKVLSLFFNFLIRILWQIPYRDTQGVKVWKASALKKIMPKAKTNGFLFDLEVVLYAHKLGLKITEVPWTYTYTPGSKVRIRSILQMVIELMLLRINWQKTSFYA